VQTNLERYKKDLSKLIELGQNFQVGILRKYFKEQGKLDKTEEEEQKKVPVVFETHYQRWYTEACTVIRQLLPQRLNEFEALYAPDPRRKTLDSINYTIQDWLVGERSPFNELGIKKAFDDFGITGMKFTQQIEILRSVEVRFESSLFDIRQLVQADLFDSELDAARALLKKGFLRAAGIVAGVVLEKHLAQVCDNHSVPVRKQHPTINGLNELLKNNNIIDTPNWRFLQRLDDLRNMCGHNKQREPDKEEVTELIGGVDKVTKTLF